MRRPLRADGTTGQDATISERHKTWGSDVPTADLDFPVYEFGHSKAVALIEYKQYGVDNLVLERPRVQAFFTISPTLPTAVVAYDSSTDPWFMWFVRGNKPMRESLKAFFGQDYQITEYGPAQCRALKLTELQFVNWLAHLRNCKTPLEVRARLGDESARTEMDALLKQQGLDWLFTG